jgi:multidrug efflux pump subunit AcrB
MVDAVIIMIENTHKHMEHDGGKKPHWDIIRDAAIEVGPTLFYSLLVITVSFVPIFTLESQEGRLFGPLAFTISFALLGSLILSLTLVPTLCARARVPLSHRLVRAPVPLPRVSLPAFGHAAPPCACVPASGGAPRDTATGMRARAEPIRARARGPIHARTQGSAAPPLTRGGSRPASLSTRVP